jgi:hypothetical protein
MIDASITMAEFWARNDQPSAVSLTRTLLNPSIIWLQQPSMQIAKILLHPHGLKCYIS